MDDRDLAFDQPAEGFRGVRWCTRRGDIPWAWSASGFGAPCAQRATEDLDVFGVEAAELTYTFRNSLLYGVRIDLAEGAPCRALVEALKKEYPPALRVARGGSATAYLWGRHRMFADDSETPIHLALPPRLNNVPGPYVPRHYVCYRASGPIRVDGRLDEKAWRDAQWSDFFQDHQAPYAPPPWKSVRVKMLYDDAHLYIGAQLQEENVWGSLVERDCVIYYDNDFEVFLDPTADGVGYYELEINPLNTMWDMFHETDYHRASALHTLYDVAGMEHAVQVQGTLNWHRDTDIGWTVEIKVPLESLLERNRRISLPIKRGDQWQANFSRVQYLHLYDRLYPAKIPQTPCEDWIWQSTDTGDLHNPEMWGRVFFWDHVAGTVRDEDLEHPGGEPMVYLGMRAPFIYDKPSKFRVVRGGGWTKQEGCMAAAYRDAHGSLNMGFRCIRPG